MKAIVEIGRYQNIEPFITKPLIKGGLKQTIICAERNMINTKLIFSTVFALFAMSGTVLAQSSGSGIQIETSGPLCAGGSSFVVPSPEACDGAVYQWSQSVDGELVFIDGSEADFQLHGTELEAFVAGNFTLQITCGDGSVIAGGAQIVEADPAQCQ